MKQKYKKNNNFLTGDKIETISLLQHENKVKFIIIFIMKNIELNFNLWMGIILYTKSKNIK